MQPLKWSESQCKCSATYVLIYVEALIYMYIAKRLVVVVVISSVQVVKPLSRLSVVHSEVMHLLECLLGLNAKYHDLIKMGVTLIKWA